MSDHRCAILTQRGNDYLKRLPLDYSRNVLHCLYCTTTLYLGAAVPE